MNTMDAVAEAVAQIHDLRDQMQEVSYSVAAERELSDALYRYFNACRAKWIEQKATPPTGTVQAPEGVK